MRDASQKLSLAELAQAVQGEVLNCRGDSAVLSLAVDSRKVGAGALFAAVPGTARDGHQFLDEAFARGAAAALVSRKEALAGRPGIWAADTRRALSALAALFCGDPSRRLAMVGVTGTNGKTTIHYLLCRLLGLLGTPCMRVGTLGINADGILDEPSLTTPDALDLQRVLSTGLKGGVSAAVMEVSSHGLDQHRADDVAFDAAVFTNLTRDHLDYHGDMESYFAAKRRLFELLAARGKGAKAAVINADDEYGRRLLSATASNGSADFSFGTSPRARVRWSEFRQALGGSRMQVAAAGRSYEVVSGFIGEHNAQNLAAVFAAAWGLGFDPARIAPRFTDLPQVPGRLEAVGGEGLGVYVDYAHTPDALEHALRALRPVARGALWVVFGCGGDRDRGKRPQMGQIACRLADRVVVTSDNPRTENPQRIINDILAAGGSFTVVEPDRRRAIEAALSGAGRGDVVLIAGKGHEDYQIIGREKIHFSDQEEVRRIMGASK